MKNLKSVTCLIVALVFLAGCKPALHTPRGTYVGEGDPAWPWGACYLVVPKYNKDKIIQLSKQVVRGAGITVNKKRRIVYSFRDISNIHYLLYAAAFNLNTQGKWVDNEVGRALESFFEQSDEEIICDALVFASAFPDLRKGAYTISRYLSNSELEKRLFEVVKRYGDRQMIDDALMWGPPLTRELVVKWVKKRGGGLGNPYMYIPWDTYYRKVFVLLDNEELAELENMVKNGRGSFLASKLIDRLLVLGSYYCRKNTDCDQLLARRIYDILKKLPTNTLFQAVKRTYLFAINDLPLVAFYVRLGVLGTETYLFDILNSYKYGYRRMNMLRRWWSQVIPLNGLFSFYDPPPTNLFKATRKGLFEDYLWVHTDLILRGAGMQPLHVTQTQIDNYFKFLDKREIDKKYPPRLRLHSLEIVMLYFRCGNFSLEEAAYKSLWEMSKWLRIKKSELKTKKLEWLASYPIIRWGSFNPVEMPAEK
ncbi:MAG: hypothetical protein JRJ13_08175 [Deltaproteobacteria bacterium]|nr:hypothetical protein [Deltaproteobacteria bacterium]MBW2025073.1 hypothetical protein [Deltaproteobacteria bacterium]